MGPKRTRMRLEISRSSVAALALRLGMLIASLSVVPLAVAAATIPNRPDEETSADLPQGS